MQIKRCILYTKLEAPQRLNLFSLFSVSGVSHPSRDQIYVMLKNRSLNRSIPRCRVWRFTLRNIVEEKFVFFFSCIHCKIKHLMLRFMGVMQLHYRSVRDKSLDPVIKQSNQSERQHPIQRERFTAELNKTNALHCTQESYTSRGLPDNIARAGVAAESLGFVLRQQQAIRIPRKKFSYFTPTLIVIENIHQISTTS